MVSETLYNPFGRKMFFRAEVLYVSQ